MRWIVLLSVIVFATACSKDNADITPAAKASVKVTIDAAEMSGGGDLYGYRRGTAPDFIEGVTVSAKHKIYSTGHDVSYNFYFNSHYPNDGKYILLQAITVGDNEIDAVGICKNDPKNSRYDVDVEDYNTIVDLNYAATQYGWWLKTNKQGIYANYYAETKKTVTIVKQWNPAINLHMVTTNHRVAVVMANNSTVYDIKWKMAVKNSSAFYTSDFMGNNAKDSYIVNDENAVGTKTYVVTLEYYYRNTHEKVLNDDGTHKIAIKEIPAVAYDNIIRYYKFENNTLKEGKANVGLSWQPLNDIIDGEPLL